MSVQETETPSVKLAPDVRVPLAVKTIPMLKFSQMKPVAPKLFGDARELEAMVVEDMLYVLMGVEGNFVRFSDSYDPNSRIDRLRGPTFRVSRHMDPSLMDLALSITETARYYLALDAFVQYQGAPTFGQVNQAFCASIRKILKEYLLLVTNFENQMLFNPEFTMHSLNVQLLPMAGTLRQTYDTVQAVLRENDRKRDQAKNTFDIDELLENVKDNHNFRFLDSFASSSARICKGGSILRLLSSRLEKYSGDPNACNLLRRLLKDSSKPYLKMLEQWTHKGIIDDPYDEFLVVQTETLDTHELDIDFIDEYWDRRYQIRKHDLPVELSNPEIYEKILLTGKYLNVIRECGGVDASTETEGGFYSIEDSTITMNISRLYNHANQSLLKLLTETHGLSTWMTSLKHYFFLDQADFFVNFLETAGEELRKPIQEVSEAKIQYLLDMALRQPGTISAEDPLKDDILVTLNSDSLTEQLTDIIEVTGINPEELRQQVGINGKVQYLLNQAGEETADSSDKKKKKRTLHAINAMEFDFKIPFPLSLVLSQNAMIRYKILFRNLVGFKSAELNLNEAWTCQTKSPIWSHKSENEELNRWKFKAHQVRMLMTLVIQQIMYFCTMEVLHANWAKLEKSLKNIDSVDLLRNTHIGFLDTCMKECMLLTPALFNKQERLLRSCRIYSQFMMDAERAILIVDPSAIPDIKEYEKRLAQLPALTDIPDNSKEQMKFLDHYFTKINNNFIQSVRGFIKNLNYYASTDSTVLMNLTASLEFLMADTQQSEVF